MIIKYYCVKYQQKIINKRVSEMTKRTLAICCAILIIILMATPFGVRMVFFGEVSEETSDQNVRFKSFFGSMSAEHESLLPVSLANDPTILQVENNISFYYSYFSPMPIGYANFFPIITAVLTLVILALLLIGLKKDTRGVVSICALGCVLASAISWLVFSAFSTVGMLIMFLHIIICVFQIEKRAQKIETTPETELWKMK